YGIRSTTYPSYALNLAQLGALCISNLCATKPLADEKCNSDKSDFLALEEFFFQWQERNQNFDNLITEQLSKLGFLTNIERSHSVANWAYRQAKENGYLLWPNKLESFS
ncbi:hypothetical protein ACF8FD_16230, partial [Acinetobacter sp. TYF_19]